MFLWMGGTGPPQTGYHTQISMQHTYSCPFSLGTQKITSNCLQRPCIPVLSWIPGSTPSWLSLHTPNHQPTWVLPGSSLPLG